MGVGGAINCFLCGVEESDDGLRDFVARHNWAHDTTAFVQEPRHLVMRASEATAVGHPNLNGGFSGFGGRN